MKWNESGYRPKSWPKAIESLNFPAPIRLPFPISSPRSQSGQRTASAIDADEWRGMFFGECPHLLPNAAHRASAIRREIVRDADRAEKDRRMLQNLRRRVPAVKVAQQPGDGLHDQRIGFAAKPAPTVAEILYEPKLGHAACDQIGIEPTLDWEHRPLAGAFDQPREPRRRILQRGQFFGQPALLLIERHNATLPRAGPGVKPRSGSNAARRRAAGADSSRESGRPSLHGVPALAG